MNRKLVHTTSPFYASLSGGLTAAPVFERVMMTFGGVDTEVLDCSSVLDSGTTLR